jgi:hypothetical protein
LDQGLSKNIDDFADEKRAQLKKKVEAKFAAKATEDFTEELRRQRDQFGDIRQLPTEETAGQAGAPGIKAKGADLKIEELEILKATKQNVEEKRERRLFRRFGAIKYNETLRTFYANEVNATFRNKVDEIASSYDTNPDRAAKEIAAIQEEMLKALGETTPEALPDVGASMQEYGDTAIRKIFGQAIDDNIERMNQQSVDTFHRESRRGLQIASDVNVDPKELADRKYDIEREVAKLYRMGVYTAEEARQVYNAASDEFNTTVVTAQYNADVDFVAETVRVFGANSKKGKKAIADFTARYENYHTDHTKTVDNTVPKVGLLMQEARDAGEISMYGDATWFGERPKFAIPNFAGMDKRSKKGGAVVSRRDDLTNWFDEGGSWRSVFAPPMTEEDIAHARATGSPVVEYTSEGGVPGALRAERAEHHFNVSNGASPQKLRDERRLTTANRIAINFWAQGKGPDSKSNHPGLAPKSVLQEAKVRLTDMNKTKGGDYPAFKKQVIDPIDELITKLDEAEGDPNLAAQYAFDTGVVSNPSQLWDDVMNDSAIPDGKKFDMYFNRLEDTYLAAHKAGATVTGNESGKFGVSKEALERQKAVFQSLETMEEQADFLLQSTDMFIRLDPSRARDHIRAVAGPENEVIATVLYQAATVQDDDAALSDLYRMGMGARGAKVETLVAAAQASTDWETEGLEASQFKNALEARIFGNTEDPIEGEIVNSVYAELDEHTRDVLLLQRGLNPRDARDQAVTEALLGKMTLSLVQTAVDNLDTAPTVAKLNSIIDGARAQVKERFEEAFEGLQVTEVEVEGRTDPFRLILSDDVREDDELMDTVASWAGESQLIQHAKFAREGAGIVTPDVVKMHVVDGIMYLIDLTAGPGEYPFILDSETDRPYGINIQTGAPVNAVRSMPNLDMATASGMLEGVDAASDLTPEEEQEFNNRLKEVGDDE